MFSKRAKSNGRAKSRTLSDVKSATQKLSQREMNGFFTELAQRVSHPAACAVLPFGKRGRGGGKRTRNKRSI